MKKWLLYFFVLSLVLTASPFVARELVGERETEVSVMIKGEIISMKLEDYIVSAVVGEGQVCESLESKKALAVAIRSCCMYSLSFGGKHSDFDFCDDYSCCFAVGDIENYDETARETVLTATNETKGVFLTYKNQPARSLFTLCSGSSSAFLEGAEELLPTKEENVCEIHKTETTICYEGLLSKRENAVLVYDEYKDCDFAVWDGSYIKGNELREKLGLPSTEFVLEFREDGIFAVSYGLGNGFGMSLCHAEQMAKSGKTYDEILRYYYTNFEVVFGSVE